MRIMFSLLILLLFTIKCQGLNYCNSTICKNSKYESLCKLQSSDPARHCIDVQAIIKTEQDRKALLDKINSRRNKVASGEIRSLPSASDMLKLEWSKELEERAQKWANQCIKTRISDLKDPCRDIGNTSVGQNIATITGEAPGLILSALVDIWYMELLNFNTSLISGFRESVETGLQHYEYFTQLVWSETRQVGCAGVRFKELLEGTERGENRTVYRLVCNFMPGGNKWNKSVYAHGTPCSQCPNASCDDVYKTLCGSPDTAQDDLNVANESTIRSSLKLATEVSETVPIATQAVEDTTDTEDDTLTLFDFFSHFRNFTIPSITITTEKLKCNDNILAIDDFVDLLKKKLSSDSTFKDLLFATKYPHNLNMTLSDPHVASFVNRIYSKKQDSTTTKSTESDLFNSTLLVDLVEAVIFRSGDRIPTFSDFEKNTHATSQVSPIKIQAELSQTQLNIEFSGHYFFPEDESDEATVETTEAYYDVSPPSIADIFIEIEDIKKSTTSNDFLDEILDFDSSTENLSIGNLITPGGMSTYSGRNVMKKFLEDIRKNNTDTL